LRPGEARHGRERGSARLDAKIDGAQLSRRSIQPGSQTTTKVPGNSGQRKMLGCPHLALPGIAAKAAVSPLFAREATLATPRQFVASQGLDQGPRLGFGRFTRLLGVRDLHLALPLTMRAANTSSSFG
jgi:hypothetical protein